MTINSVIAQFVELEATGDYNKELLETINEDMACNEIDITSFVADNDFVGDEDDIHNNLDSCLTSYLEETYGDLDGIELSFASYVVNATY